MKFIKVLLVSALVISFAGTSIAGQKCRSEQLALNSAKAAANKAERSLALAQKKYDVYDRDGGLFDRLDRQVELAERQYDSKYNQISARIAQVQGIEKEIEENTDGRIITSVVCFLFCGSKNPIRDAKNEADRQIKMRALKQKYYLKEQDYQRSLQRLQTQYQTKQARLASDKVKLQNQQAAALSVVNTMQTKLDTANALLEQKEGLLEACIAAN